MLILKFKSVNFSFKNKLNFNEFKIERTQARMSVNSEFQIQQINSALELRDLNSKLREDPGLRVDEIKLLGLRCIIGANIDTDFKINIQSILKIGKKTAYLKFVKIEKNLNDLIEGTISLANRDDYFDLMELLIDEAINTILQFQSIQLKFKRFGKNSIN